MKGFDIHEISVITGPDAYEVITEESKKLFNIHVLSVVTGPAAVLQTIWCQFMKEFDIHVISVITGPDSYEVITAESNNKAHDDLFEVYRRIQSTSNMQSTIYCPFDV